MSEELRIVPRAVQVPAPTLRDLLAVVFRQGRLLGISFATIFLATLSYGIFFPSYQSEMKVLIRRGRVDPLLTPAPTPPPEFARNEVSEEELNSEVELLRDQDILRTVAQRADLQPKMDSWFTRLTSQTPEIKMEHTVRRLARSCKLCTKQFSRSSKGRAFERKGHGNADVQRGAQPKRVCCGHTLAPLPRVCFASDFLILGSIDDHIVPAAGFASV